MCEYVKDILIGIVAGIVSGIIVKVIFDIKERKNNIKDALERDKQNYHRYIEEIRTEILLAYKNNEYDFLIRKIENEPIRESFIYLSKEEKEKVEKINECIHDIKETVKKENFSMTESCYKKLSRRLFKCSVTILK